MRKDTDDVGIAAVGFGPCFFEDGYPDLFFVGLAEDGVSFVVDWYVVID